MKNTNDEIAALEARLDALSFNVSSDAATELAAAREQLDTLCRQQAIEAERERAEPPRRRTAEAKARERARVRKLRARLDRLHDERLDAARKAAGELDALRVAVDDVMRIGREMYSVSAELGEARRRYLLDNTVGAFVMSRLAGLIGALPSQDRAYRRPLAEMRGPSADLPDTGVGA